MVEGPAGARKDNLAHSGRLATTTTSYPLPVTPAYGHISPLEEQTATTPSIRSWPRKGGHIHAAAVA